ncbi:peroxide stress protein YaaA [Streptomyces triticirhizae]|uniref:Peroxide stress protein YaaA n=1 Tax=Streptomyces triticirhizae TaxID=2483353 RepID=A0A3M2M5Y6_9ACTN|nr:peroxide stress protein YaaA [Streptomyces triticirhizae]RMI44410.1 peroxide stress protein YaaA [Streptomyces triticirhizae]
MLVLLPPSEGKAGASRGRPLAWESLSLPALTEARARVLDELVELCSGDPSKAREVLGLSEGQSDEVARNARLVTAPTAPAGAVYTGVLYDALGLASLSPAAKRRAGKALLVFSGLWGALRIGDRIPAYRCSGGVKLPGLGPLAGHWRGPLGEVLPEVAGGGPVLDLRSAAYAALWHPTGELAERTLTVRVLQERMVNGTPKRSVVSHFNKATKGRLVRDLLEAGPLPRRAGLVAGALRELGYRVEEDPAAPGRLDVVVTEV